MRLKVLYIVSSFMKCGPMNMLHTLISGLSPDEFEVHAITLKPEPQNSMIDAFLSLGVSVHRVGNSRTHLPLGLRKAIQGVVDELKPEIVHSHGLWGDYYLSSIDAHVSVMNIHNKLVEDYVPMYGPIIGRAAAAMDARAMRTPDIAVSVSHSVARIALIKYRIHSEVIYNGVDTNRYHPCQQSDVARLRDALGMSKGSYVFLHIGNMIARKRPELLASAFAEALKSADGMELYFLGDGPLLKECQEKFKGCSHIHFEGNVDNVDEFMKAADAMVSATTSDGLSMATLEGLACGLRTLMSDIDVHREILENLIGDVNDFILCGDAEREFVNGYLKLANGGHQKNSVPKYAISGRGMSAKYAVLYKKLARNSESRKSNSSSRQSS